MIDFNIKKIEKALKNVRKPSHNEKPSMLSPKLDKKDKNSMHQKAKSLSKYPDPSELKTPELPSKHMLPILYHSTHHSQSKMPSKFFSNPIKSDLFFKKVYEMDSRIISLELNQDDMLAIGNENGELVVYNNYHCEELIASISNQNSILINIRWIPCAFQPILGLEWVDGTIGIFNTKEGKLIEKIKENHKLYAFDFNCDGRYMASGGSSSQVINFHYIK